MHIFYMINSLVFMNHNVEVVSQDANSSFH
jgi:hypothetical protein